MMLALILLCGAAGQLSLPPLWTRGEAASASDSVHVIVAVKYAAAGVAQLERELLSRSDPRSSAYGKGWMSRSDIDAFLRPEERSLDAVREWLGDVGVGVAWTASGAFAHADVTAKQYEDLTGMALTRFHHASGASALRVDRASCALPASVAAHIDVVSPCAGRFPPQPRGASPPPGPEPNPAPSPPTPVTPDVLRARYNLSGEVGAGNASANTQAIANFLGQYIEQSDLDKFFAAYAPSATVTHPSAIVGENHGYDPGVEAALDSEYIMGVGRDTNTIWYFTEGRQPGNPSDEPWLAWLSVVSNETVLPLVFSASYTDYESHVDFDYSERCNVELRKVGVRGTSLLMASGDHGSGAGYGCTGPNACPEFPAESPWITSVGGTALRATSGGGGDDDSAATEIAWGMHTALGSGGGFSNRFARPPYQDAAVRQYIANATAEGRLPENASTFFNASGRAYPDLATLATPYQTYCQGFVQIGTGTSASTPTMAAIVAFLNAHRLAANKTSLGFLNPVIHGVWGPGGALNDITEGITPGYRGHVGFAAVTGYDTTTGWGTPDFGKMLDLVMALP